MTDEAHTNPYAAPAHQVEPEAAWSGPFRPWLSIWTHPRPTIRRIVAENPQRQVMLLAALSGVGNTLDRASQRGVGDGMPLLGILAVAAVLGPISGWIGLWIMSHLVRWTGHWLGGQAPREHIKAALAWAEVPSVASLALWIPLIALMGNETFTSESPEFDAQPILLLPLLAIGLAEVVIGLWGLVLMCNTVAEVQGYRSAWRGLGNLLLPIAVILVPIAGIVVVVVVLRLAL